MDAVLRCLRLMDVAGELEPAELSAEIERLAVYRKVGSATVWRRWDELKNPDICAMVGI
jgi:hypothetical protein